MQLETDNFIADLERWFVVFSNNMYSSAYSPNTIELYTRVFEQFKEYCLGFQDEMRLSDIRSMFFDGYIRYAEDEARQKNKQKKHGFYLSKSTKNTYFKALRAYFSFISDNNDELYTFERATKKLGVKDTSKKEENLEYLTDKEVERLLNIINKDKEEKGTYNTYRDSFLTHLMLDGGLRISEALDITLGNFVHSDDPRMYLIEIYGKGGKEQIGYIAKSIVEEDMEYFKKQAKLDEDDFIMKTKKGRLSRISAWRIFKNKYKAAMIKKQGLHILRHTCAMRLTKKGVDLTVIKKILRHSSIATTTIYAKATNEMVVDAIV